jgi:hypothetical protein
MSGSRIEHEFFREDDADVHGEAGEHDFETERDLKRRIEEFTKSFRCPSCGGHRVSGRGLIVVYSKVNVFREDAEKGWFGRVRFKDKKVATVWRIVRMSLRDAPGRALLNLFGLFDPPPGKVQCDARGCGWSESGSRGGTISFAECFQWGT